MFTFAVLTRCLFERQTASDTLRGGSHIALVLFDLSHRDGGILTRHPLNPIQVRYPAPLRPPRGSKPLRADRVRSIAPNHPPNNPLRWQPIAREARRAITDPRWQLRRSRVEPTASAGLVSHHHEPSDNPGTRGPSSPRSSAW